MDDFRENQLAWIFGSSRSGSTWLLRMLADTGELLAIDDPHLGHHLGTWRPISLAYAASAEPLELSTLTEVKRHKPSYFLSDRYAHAWRPALRDLIAARFLAEAEANANGAARGIVVKEPGSQVAELLLSLFPRSSLIFLLRDGRDVVDSWLAAYSEGSWAQSEGAFAAAPRARLPLIRWLASVWLYRTEAVQRAFAQHRDGARVLVRYEDLLSAPATQLEQIARALRLDATSGDLARIARARDFAAVDPTERGEREAVRQAEPGAWRERLSSRERAALTDMLGAKLAELGYARERRAPLAA